jgi:hypothetical protein
MTPEALAAASFASYAPAAQQFATEHLNLLRRLPLAVCPSFLQQVKEFDTLFPVERESLRHQFQSLEKLDAQRFAAITAPLRSLKLSNALQQMNWVSTPGRFVTDLSTFLWSSGQLDTFRKAAQDLFAEIPAQQDTASRLAIVILGQGAAIDSQRILRKLRRNGVYLTSFQHASAWDQMAELASSRVVAQPQDYAHWYVDGGSSHPVLASAFRRGIHISYPALEPVRKRILSRMEEAVASPSGGAEDMRDRLLDTSRLDAGVAAVTSDPILQRFYTDLFTQSSGPQIFSTCFVQWTGRELARRAQPKTVILRYAPRQQRQDMNTMFANATPHGLDPQGSLRDAEMGAFYHWIEMQRITAPGKLTFIAWVEEHPYAVVCGPGAAAGAISTSPLTLQQTVKSFG